MVASSRLSRARRRARRLTVYAIVAAVSAALLALGTAQRATAAHTNSWTIGSLSGGFADQLVGGWFDGMVVFSTSGDSVSRYKWTRSGDHYTGPGGREYYSYKHNKTGKCLSHASDIVMAVPCNWNDYSQWWSVEPVLLGYTPIPPCSGCPPFMVPKWADLMTSWTAPTKLITNESSLAVLRPRVGTLGSPAQHLGVGEHVIIT